MKLQDYNFCFFNVYSIFNKIIVFLGKGKSILLVYIDLENAHDRCQER